MKRLFLFLSLATLLVAFVGKEKTIQIVECGNLSYGLYDTLHYEGLKILLMKSPLFYTGHEYRLVNTKELLDDTSNSPRVIVSYVVEDGRLAISKVSVRGYDMPNDTMIARLEKLTGNKMNRAGHFPLNISDSFIGRANAERFPAYYVMPYLIPGTGTVYKIELDSGKIVKMQDITETEKIERDRLKRFFEYLEKNK